LCDQAETLAPSGGEALHERAESLLLLYLPVRS